MIVVTGLKNCDTCRNAIKWLKAEGIDARLHDVRADGLDPAALDGWIAAVGWETLLNRRGTTWRGLPDADKADVDAAKARALMLAHPALIKRPVFDLGGKILVGFGAQEKAALKGA
jgi:arsenate reductase